MTCLRTSFFFVAEYFISYHILFIHSSVEHLGCFHFLFLEREQRRKGQRERENLMLDVEPDMELDLMTLRS